ncbi:Hypothetical predicted protein [Olea europaea subsp. europaea]|uniref:Uncharacterized protein n=1 Tax=Olea europaea subsp. europaea TaxID=158383 RepID=A0A8S0V412_OLEEU|nr:Hypothetical predicted protein [Olea europaea subsp. europaea]
MLIMGKVAVLVTMMLVNNGNGVIRVNVPKDDVEVNGRFRVDVPSFVNNSGGGMRVKTSLNENNGNVSDGMLRIITMTRWITMTSIQELRTGRDDSKFWCLYSTSVARPQPFIYRPPMRSDHFIVGPHILVETQCLYWAMCRMT